jgi:hypothetical protein
MDRIAIISPDATEEMLAGLVRLGIEPLVIPRTGLVHGPISGHPDLQLFIHGNKAFCHPALAPDFLWKLNRHAEVIVCATRLSAAYPGDVPYNVACTGSHAFHHPAAIDTTVRDHLAERGVALCGVSQGYAKCSTCIVGERAVITADASIHQAASSNGLDSLLIAPGSIELPGYGYGFIGGATGTAGDMVLITGSLTHHPDYEAMADFVGRHGKRIAPLSRLKAVDLGTIFIL